MLKDRYPGLKVPRPKIYSNPEDMIKSVIEELNLKNTKSLKGIFLVIDMDVFYKDNKKMESYKRRKKQIEKMGEENLHFIESRPCIEFWFLLHFEQTDKLFESCNEVEKELKKEGRLPDYCKKDNYTEKLYSKLKNLINIATTHSKWILEKERVTNEDYSYTYMHKMIETLDDIHY